MILMRKCTKCHGRGLFASRIGERDVVDIGFCPWCDGTGYVPTEEGNELAKFIKTFYGQIPNVGVFDDEINKHMIDHDMTRDEMSGGGENV